VSERVDALVIEPGRDLRRIESEQMAPLQVWDASLCHEASNVPHGHTEVIGDLVDVQQSR
jgi:hypothetical protein